MYEYTNKISDIGVVTDNPEIYTSFDLRRAIHDAKTVYEHGNKSFAWYEQVKRICNEVYKSRGETPE